MCVLLLQGLTLVSKRGFSEEEGALFAQQLVAYKKGKQPYNRPWGGPRSTVRDWWEIIYSPQIREIHAIATLLCDVVPHAAANERSFSMLNEFDSGHHPLSMLQICSC